MQSLKLNLNASKALPDKTRDDVLSADLQNDSLATNPESILTNLNAVHNYLKSLNIGEVDHEALKKYQNILQKFYESLTNKADEASDKVSDKISEIFNKINQQFLKFEKEILQQSSYLSGSTKLTQILEVQTPRSIGTPRNITPRDELIISQQQKISESSEMIRDLNLKINQLQETVKEIDAQKTLYQQELSFYKEQNQFLDQSNTDLKDQLKSLEKKLEDQSRELKSLKYENDKLTKEKELIAISDNHETRAHELKIKIQELSSIFQEFENIVQEFELEKLLRENPIHFSSSRLDIDSQPDQSPRAIENELSRNSVLGQGARADESDFPLENNSQTSGDDLMQRPDPTDNSIYFSSQPDSGLKILTQISNPFLERLQPDTQNAQSSQPQKGLELTTGDLARSPIAISSTPQNTNQNLATSTSNSPIAIATLGFATQSSSSESDSPDQQQKPSNSPSIQPQQNQLFSTTASQEAELNSSNSSLPRNANSLQSPSPSCFARLLPRCLSPTPD